MTGIREVGCKRQRSAIDSRRVEPRPCQAAQGSGMEAAPVARSMRKAVA